MVSFCSPQETLSFKVSAGYIGKSDMSMLYKYKYVKFIFKFQSKILLLTTSGHLNGLSFKFCHMSYKCEAQNKEHLMVSFIKNISFDHVWTYK